jgi:hypothetical protein
MTVNDKLRRIWKETVMAYFKPTYQHFLEAEKNHKNA